jgi:hypothetical protein
MLTPLNKLLEIQSPILGYHENVVGMREIFLFGHMFTDKN